MGDSLKFKFGIQRDDVTIIPNEIWDLYLPHIGGNAVMVYGYLLRLVSNRSRIDFKYIADELQMAYEAFQEAIAILTEFELLTFAGTNTLKINHPCNERRFQRYMQQRTAYATGKQGSDSGDETLQKVLQSYQEQSIYAIAEKEFGRPLRPAEYKALAQMEKESRRELIIEAIARAVINQAFNMQYVQSIIHNWNLKGVKTLEEVRQDDERFKARKKKQKRVSVNKTPTEKRDNQIPEYYKNYKPTQGSKDK